MFGGSATTLEYHAIYYNPSLGCDLSMVAQGEMCEIGRQKLLWKECIAQMTRILILSAVDVD